MYGDTGDDTIYADARGDLIYGGVGNDQILAGAYANTTDHITAYGDAGNDAWSAAPIATSSTEMTQQISLISTAIFFGAPPAAIFSTAAGAVITSMVE
jgi:Ca2+-binding RTX toxin-like protein